MSLSDWFVLLTGVWVFIDGVQGGPTVAHRFLSHAATFVVGMFVMALIIKHKAIPRSLCGSWLKNGTD